MDCKYSGLYGHVCGTVIERFIQPNVKILLCTAE